MIDENGDSEIYSSSGQLLSIAKKSGDIESLVYNGDGLLASVTDKTGRSLDFSYTGGFLTSVGLPDGGTVVYGYDPYQRLSAVTYPDGKSLSYTYSTDSLKALLTGVIDENNQQYATFSYDSSDRATGDSLAGGVNATAISYIDDDSRTIMDVYGTSRTYHYALVNGRSKITAVNGPYCATCGISASYTYDSRGYPLQRTDFSGNITQITYDNNGLELARVEAQGTLSQRTITTSWDANLRAPLLRIVKNAAGTTVAKSAWIYNTRGQVVAFCGIDPAVAGSYTCTTTGSLPTGVSRTINTYCDAITPSCPVIGLLLTIDGPRSDISDLTTYTYYTTSSTSACGTPGSACHQAGDLYTVQDALGHTTTYASYDGAGRVTRITDPSGVNTDITYDPRGRVLTRSYGGATTTYGYDPVGNLTQVTDPDNVVTHYTYDAAHRLTDITDALGNHIHYTLDNAGNKTAETVYDASNTVKRSIGRTFNALGQLTALHDGLNNTVLNAGFTDSYDANGNLVHTADALGIQRQSSFDSLNRLITTLDNYNGTDPATRNTTTQYGYDGKDNLVQVTDASNLATTYTLDGLNNQTALASPDTGTATATFDAAGNQLTRTDARGIVATSTYDALNRIASTTYADTSLNVAYHYDEASATTGCTSSQPLGRLTRVVEVAVTTTYCYDGRGNVIRKTQTQGAVTDATAMAYTSGDRLQSLTYPSGTVVSYTRNANGQVSAATLTPTGGTATSAMSNMAYLPFGPVLSYTLGNGQTVTRTYDANYAFTDVVSPALAIHVARDAAGNVIALGPAHGANPATETYRYDPLYRLTGVMDGTTTVQALTYNATGDRLSKTGTGFATGTYSYAPGTHRLNAVGNGARAFDANGNTTASEVAGQNFGFGYNGRDRMTVVQASGQTVGTYVYNDAGQRISKATTLPTSSIERFLYAEGSILLGEYGASTREYVWAESLPIAVIDEEGTDSTISYVHADGLNTPRAVTTSAGTENWQWPLEGNAFGELPPSGSYLLNLRFPGQYYDEETGFHNNLFRDFDPSTGRYEEPDPSGLGGGVNIYLYGNANPLLYFDLTGMQAVAPAIPAYPVTDPLAPNIPSPARAIGAVAGFCGSNPVSGAVCVIAACIVPNSTVDSCADEPNPPPGSNCPGSNDLCAKAKRDAQSAYWKLMNKRIPQFQSGGTRGRDPNHLRSILELQVALRKAIGRVLLYCRPPPAELEEWQRAANLNAPGF